MSPRWRAARPRAPQRRRRARTGLSASCLSYQGLANMAARCGGRKRELVGGDGQLHHVAGRDRDRLGHGRSLAADEIDEELQLVRRRNVFGAQKHRSEEHTSELQSLAYLVCRLLLEK